MKRIDLFNKTGSWDLVWYGDFTGRNIVDNFSNKEYCEKIAKSMIIQHFCEEVR